MANYFGTDGIRGRFGEPIMDLAFAYRFGAALGSYLRATSPRKGHFVVIGRDTRKSGVLLSDAMIRGLNQYEVYVHDAGIVPTPAVAKAVLEHHADLGVVITASHNPAPDNGIKIFDCDGRKIGKATERALEKFIDSEPSDVESSLEPKSVPIEAASFYVNELRSMLDENCLSDWRIVLDLANGAAAKTTPAVFRRWGAELYLIGDQPDGDNINAGVGSEHPEPLARAVVKYRAALGIAHDGDGDRLVVCDEKGEIVDGDILLGLFGRYAMLSDSLNNGVLVATIHSNLGLDQALREAGGRVERVGVGDREVAERMQELDASIGGESSGHVIFSDFGTTGDGLLAAVKIIELMRRTGKRLSELRKEVVLYPQATRNLRVADKIPLDQCARLQASIREVECELAETGRVLVRYSGTEPKLRLLVEGQNLTIVEAALKRIEKAARSDLTVIES